MKRIIHLSHLILPSILLALGLDEFRVFLDAPLRVYVAVFIPRKEAKPV